MSVRASRGRKVSFCSWLPKIFNGCGTPMDWWAESSAPMAGLTEPTRARALL